MMEMFVRIKLEFKWSIILDFVLLEKYVRNTKKFDCLRRFFFSHFLYLFFEFGFETHNPPKLKNKCLVKVGEDKYIGKDGYVRFFEGKWNTSDYLFSRLPIGWDRYKITHIKLEFILLWLKGRII